MRQQKRINKIIRFKMGKEKLAMVKYIKVLVKEITKMANREDLVTLNKKKAKWKPKE